MSIIDMMDGLAGHPAMKRSQSGALPMGCWTRIAERDLDGTWSPAPGAPLSIQEAHARHEAGLIFLANRRNARGQFELVVMPRQKVRA